MRELTATPSPTALAQHGIILTEQPLGPDAVLAKLRQATN